MKFNKFFIVGVLLVIKDTMAGNTDNMESQSKSPNTGTEIEEGRCLSDIDCDDNQFCTGRGKLKRCMDCVDCTKFQKKPRMTYDGVLCASHPYQCGGCLDGYEALGGVCIPHVTTSIPSTTSVNPLSSINPAEKSSDESVLSQSLIMLGLFTIVLSIYSIFLMVKKFHKRKFKKQCDREQGELIELTTPDEAIIRQPPYFYGHTILDSSAGPSDPSVTRQWEKRQNSGDAANNHRSEDEEESISHGEDEVDHDQRVPNTNLEQTSNQSRSLLQTESLLNERNENRMRSLSGGTIPVNNLQPMPSESSVSNENLAPNPIVASFRCSIRLGFHCSQLPQQQSQMLDYSTIAIPSQRFQPPAALTSTPSNESFDSGRGVSHNTSSASLPSPPIRDNVGHNADFYGSDDSLFDESADDGEEAVEQSSAAPQPQDLPAIVPDFAQQIGDAIERPMYADQLYAEDIMFDLPINDDGGNFEQINIVAYDDFMQVEE